MTANTLLSLGSMFFITVSLTVFILKCLLFTGWTTDRSEQTIAALLHYYCSILG